MSEVRIEHVFKRFGDVTAVNDFDLTVKDLKGQPKAKFISATIA